MAPGEERLISDLAEGACSRLCAGGPLTSLRKQPLRAAGFTANAKDFLSKEGKETQERGSQTQSSPAARGRAASGERPSFCGWCPGRPVRGERQAWSGCSGRQSLISLSHRTQIPCHWSYIRRT